jgi:hypothetical protein
MIARRSVLMAVCAAFVLSQMAVASFTPQTRIGFTQGDQWEPSIAADGFGDVYVLYPQYNGVPGCPSCASPTMILTVSTNNGASWSAPRAIAPISSGQFDAQIRVDPVDSHTVYASWLQNNKSDIAFAKSTDLGKTWQVSIADHTNAGVDKDILVVHGSDIYIGFNHSQTMFVTSSHNGGVSFTQVKVNPNAKLGWSLAGGAAIDPDGKVYFAWSGYTQSGGAKGPVNLYVTRSSDGGATWAATLLDVSSSPPDCSAYSCGWAFLGAAITMTSDAAGQLYALWNAGATDKGPERIFFSSSGDGGVTWLPKQDVSLASAGVEHAFPAITSGWGGDVRIAWMDARNAPWWNVYYRSSSNGGVSWSAETRLSTYVPGYSYISPNGFSFPFGDYFEMAIDNHGKTQACWGEGLNYLTPGSIWYASGK